MRKIILIISLAILGSGAAIAGSNCDSCRSQKANKSIDEADYKITSASVKHNKAWGQLEFEILVEGTAGKSVSKPAGKMNGAPVDGYVFPTSLSSENIGFGKTEGIVALALTAHPDFDDTPLWDEDGNGNYSDDKVVWHPHWVVLVKDERVPGGLSVKEFAPKDKTIIMPKTHPGMPMYMDSPGFQVITEGNAIRVVVPTYRVQFNTNFKYDAVGVYMQLSTGEKGAHPTNGKIPMLGVYKVYSILSKDLSLPYLVEGAGF